MYTCLHIQSRKSKCQADGPKCQIDPHANCSQEQLQQLTGETYSQDRNAAASGSDQVPCYSPLKGYKNRDGGLTFKRSEGRQKMEVACGQCLGCRLDRSRIWAMRITHEASLHDNTNGNSFITLTYDNDHLPKDASLSVAKRDEKGKQIQQSHFQAFMKRLRKNNPNQKIKYYHAGEYGSTCRHGFDLEAQTCPLCHLGRPHYHACLFNKNFSDKQPYSQNYGTTRYTSAELQETWKHGFVDVGKLEYQSAAYVARYIMKKITGDQAKNHYENITDDGEIIPVEPEYSTMSNGIGYAWYQQFKGDCYPSDEIPVPGTGVIKKAPRFYDKILEQENPQLHAEVKANREKFRKMHEEEYSPERLMSKYKVKKAQIKNLSRNKI